MNRSHHRIGFLVVVAALCISIAATAQDKPASTSSGGVETFVVDNVHSSNMFKIRHNGVANFYGRFNTIKGEVKWTEADLASSSINVEVDVASVDTNNEGRDKHLRSADFFDAEKHPTITFKSTQIKAAGPHHVEVTGDLTLHGETKPITVKFENGGIAEARNGKVLGLETTFTIKRSEYGMTKYNDPKSLGDDVTMILSMECVIPRKREGS